MPHWKLERSIEEIVVGVDEVGCAPLAGPVVAAAVMLEPTLPRRLARRIDDSRKRAPEEREEIFARLPAHAKFGVGEASVDEIEQLNILRAAQLAMRRAVEALGLSAGADHRRRQPAAGLFLSRRNASGRRRDQPFHRRRLHRGQGHARPQMAVLAERFPGYGWERNVGYPTPEQPLGAPPIGATPHHRRTFRAVYRFWPQPINSIFFY